MASRIFLGVVILCSIFVALIKADAEADADADADADAWSDADAWAGAEAWAGPEAGPDPATCCSRPTTFVKGV